MAAALSGLRVGFCQPNPTWNNRVRAVFVHEGKVHDVRARYQGSRYGRQSGVPFKTAGVWPYPDAPAPAPGSMNLTQHDRFAVYSWSLNFPGFSDFEQGRRKINLNKLHESCPGINQIVAGKLFGAAGVIASQTKYARVHVNGGYYHYMLDVETAEEEMIRRVIGKGKPMGDLFKPMGVAFNEGPWTLADMSKLTDIEYAVTDSATDMTSLCGKHQDKFKRYSAAERMNATYSRRTLDWKGDSADVTKLITDLNDARGNMADMPADRVPAVRKFFQDNFDMEYLLNYRAVMNWMAPGDEFFFNYNLYRRDDKKWIIIPWDMDQMFGGWNWDAGMDPTRGVSWPAGDTKAGASFHIGEYKDRSNRSGFWHYLTDAFLKAFPEEFHQRVGDLSAPGKPLHPDSVAKAVDEWRGQFSDADANASPANFFAGEGCAGPPAPGTTVATRRNADEMATSHKAFAAERYQRVMQKMWK